MSDNQLPPINAPGQIPTPGTEQPTSQYHGLELAVTQPGEVTIFEVKRHPVGLIYIYIGITAMLLAFAALVFAILPGSGDSTSSIAQIGTIVFLVVSILAAVYGYAATQIYWGNVWILTSDSLTQISQSSLFHRESGQLSLGHIEDVTTLQSGPLPNIFGYGTLKVETAGEHEKFHFTYCPNPQYYAQKILAAREAFALNQQYGSEGSGTAAPRPHH